MGSEKSLIWKCLRTVTDSLLLGKDNENIEAFAYSMIQSKNTALTVIYVSLKC